MKGLSLYDMYLIEDALSSFATSLKQFRETGDIGGQADCLTAMGDAYQRLGWLMPHAERNLQEALAIYERLESLHGTAGVEERLGRVYAQCGRHDEARKAFRAALSV